MDFEIYIKKTITEDEMPSFYLSYAINNKVILLEISTHSIIVKEIHPEELKRDYVELNNFINKSKYIGLKDNKTGNIIIYNYLNKISIINYNNNICVSYDDNYSFNKPNGIYAYSYDEIVDKILEHTNILLQNDYLYVISEILKKFTEESMIIKMCKELRPTNKKRYYEALFNLPKTYSNDDLKNAMYKYLKDKIEIIKDNNLKNKLTDNALDGYNYLSKKLSKKI